MILKCQAWQKLLLNIINVKALEGQHKPCPLQSINCCFSLPQAAIPKGSALTVWSRGLFFFPFSLVFKLILCSGRRKKKVRESKVGAPHHTWVWKLRVWGSPSQSWASPQEKSKLWRQLSSANLGQALICWQAERNWPGFSYFIFWDEWNCSAHYDRYLTLIAEEVTEDLLIW